MTENIYVNLRVTENVHAAEYGTFVTTPDLEKEYKKDRTKVNNNKIVAINIF